MKISTRVATLMVLCLGKLAAQTAYQELRYEEDWSDLLLKISTTHNLESSEGEEEEFFR